MRHFVVAPFAVLAFTCFACSSGSDPEPGRRDLFPTQWVGCTEMLVAGLAVEVRDAVTGEPAAAGATAMIRDGSYEEMLLVGGVPFPPPPDAVIMSGAWERPGTYDIKVEKPGYTTWSRSGVEVTHDDCHVLTVRVLADLEPNR